MPTNTKKDTILIRHEENRSEQQFTVKLLPILAEVLVQSRQGNIHERD